jgi:hypothetical protein
MMSEEALTPVVMRVTHDLRQPLQTLGILIDVLRMRVEDPQVLELVERQDIAVKTIAGLLDEIDKALATR